MYDVTSCLGQYHPDRQPLEGTWDQTGSDIIHPQYCHLVAATAAVGTHPTGMHSYFCEWILFMMKFLTPNGW